MVISSGDTMIKEMYELIKKEKVICTFQLGQHFDITIDKVKLLITIMKDQNLLVTKKNIKGNCSVSSCVNNSKCGIESNLTELVDLLVLN